MSCNFISRRQRVTETEIERKGGGDREWKKQRQRGRGGERDKGWKKQRHRQRRGERQRVEERETEREGGERDREWKKRRLKERERVKPGSVCLHGSCQCVSEVMSKLLMLTQTCPKQIISLLFETDFTASSCTYIHRF